MVPVWRRIAVITLHPEEKTPLYEQLYAALAADIRSGALVPG